MKTYLYRVSNLSLFWPKFHSGSQFLPPPKPVVSCVFINIHKNNN